LAGTAAVGLGNAAPVTQGPGRKPDQAAARWLAAPLRSGLLHASFSPPKANGRRAI
jgi:hypothetical protein